MHNSVAILFHLLIFQQLWVYLLIVIFYFKFNCCAWVYILKFYHLKIVSGAMDARKWSAKWRNLNISDIFFSCSGSTERRKKRRRPEAFASCMGTMPSKRARQENDFLVLRRIDLTIMTLHIQSTTFRIWWRSFKHINPQWSTSMYSRIEKCDELWPFHYLGTFAFNGQGSKIGCMGTACPKPKS